MPTALGFAIAALNALPALIASGVNVVNLIQSTNSSLKTMQLTGTDPTDAQWKALDDMIESLRNQRPTV